MDPKPPPSSYSSSQHLRPPPHHRPAASPTSAQTQAQSSGAPRIPAKTTADPSAVIAEQTYFCGPYSISIGRGTVIHPRVRICATEGPVRIGDGCIISEKSVIGTYPPPAAAADSTSSDSGGSGEEKSIVISNNVIIGLQAVVHPGARVHSFAVVDSQAVIGRGVDVGGHAKVCARCEIFPGAKVKEWSVVWGGGKGVGLKTRVKVQKKVVSPFAFGEKGFEGVLEGKAIEDARLVTVKRERDALSRLIVGKRRA
ncbi:trimeric LpxA-like protein [Aspergillus spinulosporus]